MNKSDSIREFIVSNYKALPDYKYIAEQAAIEQTRFSRVITGKLKGFTFEEITAIEPILKPFGYKVKSARSANSKEQETQQQDQPQPHHEEQPKKRTLFKR